MMDNPTAQVTSLGGVLRSARERQLLGVADIARRSGLNVETILAVEAGNHDLGPAELDALMHHYQTPEWTTQRALGELTLDLDKGIVSFTDRESSHLIDDAADRVLARYVQLLYVQRGDELGTKIPVKDLDLNVLRAALSVRRPQVEKRIENLQTQQTTRGDVLERRARIAVGGLTVVAVALGLAIVMTGSDPEPSVGDPAATVDDEVILDPAGVEVTVEIGEALTIVRPPADPVPESGS